MLTTKIRAVHCSIPLEHPVRFAAREVTSREVLAVRIETDEGLVGEALGKPGNGAALAVLANIARLFLGSDPRMRGETRYELERGLAAERLTVMPSLSVLDIALWDLVSKQAGLSLFQLLGGTRRSIPLMPVAGYFLDRRSIDDVCHEVDGLLTAGHELVKVNFPGEDPDFALRYIRQLSRAAEGRLGIDAHWAWTRMSDAWSVCKYLDDLNLAFIEDPFAEHETGIIADLATRLKTPVATGESLTEPRALASLLQHVDILRFSVGICGGVTSAIELLATAAALGRDVLPHVAMELSAQLAGAFPIILAVESIADIAADPAKALFREAPPVLAGRVELTDAPGAGYALDWQQVERYAVHVLDVES